MPHPYHSPVDVQSPSKRGSNGDGTFAGPAPDAVDFRHRLYYNTTLTPARLTTGNPHYSPTYKNILCCAKNTRRGSEISVFSKAKFYKYFNQVCALVPAAPHPQRKQQAPPT